MAEDTLSFNYDSRVLRRRCLALLWALAAIVVTVWTLVLANGLYHSRVWLAVALVAEFAALFTLSGLPLYHVRSYLCCGWNYVRSKPAVVVTKDGPSFNACDLLYGRIAWHEIERMQPWTRERRLFANRLFRTPAAYQDKGVVIIFKEHLLVRRKPWMRKMLLKGETAAEPGKWMFLPENLLEVPAEEFIRRVNRFYTAQVRGPV